MVKSASPFSRKVRGIVTKMATPLGALSSLSTIVMMVVISVDVAARNFAGEPIAGLLEISETALVATVFLGISYAGATNAHVSVDLLATKLPTRVARLFSGIMWLLGVFVVLWFVMATADRALQSTSMGEITQGLVAWPVWPVRWLIVFGFLAFLIVAAANAYLSFRNEPLLGEDEDPLVETIEQARTDGDSVDAPDDNEETEKRL